MNFWQQLTKPIIGLSPMDGVTDHPYRHIQKKYGNPTVVYTEFASVEGICRGAKQLLKDFLYDEIQRPIVAQIYGTTPKFFRQTAVLLCELGFDGIDINMGCPAKNVAHSGAGAALIKTPELAQKIVRETQAGVKDWLDDIKVADLADITPEITAIIKERHDKLPPTQQEKRNIPVSVKTRVGYDSLVVYEWIPRLLELEPAVIAIHGRTLRQQYSGLANWDEIGKAVELAEKTDTLILGNGDVDSLTTAEKRIAEYGLDGVLIGRASMGNPYIFGAAKIDDPSLFAIAVEHAELFEEAYQNNEHYAFLPMRKNLGWYVRSIPNAKEVRSELFQTETSQEVKTILEKHHLL